MKRILSNLTVQVLIAIALGVLVGIYFPTFGPVAQRISKMFISLISMLIAPIIFFTIVLGIAGMNDMKKVGRVGGKALLYFEVVTTFALVIGVAVANLVKPGVGLNIQQNTDAGKVEQYQKQASEMNLGDFLSHIIPGNFVEAFAKGDILQVLVIAVLFGYGLSRMGGAAQSLITSFEKISKVFFNMLHMVMKLAPLGAFGGIAYTVSTQGIKTLKPLVMLMGSVYVTMALFIFIVLNLICYLCKVSLWKYLKFIRQELLIVFGTSSSESALPGMMNKLEKLGCDRSVVGLVIPTGYSFNLDGTTIYLSMATIFLAQVFKVPLSLGQELTIIAILMLTSKGAAGVTGSGFIVLTSTLAAIKIIPVEGVALLLGVDRFMSEARAITNVIGNGVATIAIAISEKAFNRNTYEVAVSQPIDNPAA
ncbi:C4-dicarboxylate transporter DctA [Mucilaginibacter aquatilis]|uniref:C4-dicarboxylate transporter DctA n=1 Tax=Mucilaginibacter aquatilis TaxID=1517760 RepID=A0A6I4IRH9_9SPHI|nr:C4-dicarboxylate transporter DctA [Mucilaginibacter aquatilis]MVN92904.1 C4-dicarboxylate transporter DctA [Mucilaginibacter aquatilis]